MLSHSRASAASGKLTFLRRDGRNENFEAHRSEEVVDHRFRRIPGDALVPHFFVIGGAPKWQYSRLWQRLEHRFCVAVSRLSTVTATTPYLFPSDQPEGVALRQLTFPQLSFT